MSTLVVSVTLVLALVASIESADAFSRSFRLQGVRSLLSMAAPPVASSKVLIIQNKGGGHGEIGFQLCKSLASMHKGVDITILQDEACNYTKLPFSKYESDLISNGVKVFNTPLTGDSSGPQAYDPIKGMKFDYIIDNWSKGEANATFAIDIATSSGASQHLFVSSAGMYKTEGQVDGCTEDAEVKENDARKVEIKVSTADTPYTFLRPQYIYGPNANKRYLDFFIGRAARKLPIPVPLDGTQKVAITHVEDVANLIACAVGKESAMNQVFNCGTDNYITYNDLVKGIHKALGNSDSDAKFIYYEPKDFEGVKGEFPFRRGTFVTSPAKAISVLGWKSSRNIADDLAEECKIYESNGGMEAKWSVERELKNDIIFAAGK